jgi:hypothetical protein
VADNQAEAGTEDNLGGLESGEAGESLVIDHLVAVLSDREQVRVAQRGQ